MRALPITVTALAAALLLTACDSGGGASDDKTAGGGAGSACAIGKVGLEVGPVNAAPAAGDTGNVSVAITNTSAECTLDGFPGITLEAGNSSTAVPQDEAAQAQKLTLAKGATASFTLTYVRGKAGDAKSLAVKTMKFGLPGATDTQSFDWKYGDVALKGGADKPDASVSAFQQAGD
ncbi:DUF4232 domain-containing protein [Streptomyces adustus]|uniref:DUF4232 domain-containing protein n=1 Tax=Streptomyces adustus TaxID=1609272 RepID=UPI00371CEB32